MEKITSRSNPICIHLKKLGKKRNYREECGEFLCDGIKLLEEAIGSFEKGIDYYNKCNEILNDAKQKIVNVQNGETL